jgi:hypothetical protein
VRGRGLGPAPMSSDLLIALIPAGAAILVPLVLHLALR